MTDDHDGAPTTTAVKDEDDVARFVRQWASLDEDGEPQAARFLVRVGKNRAYCKKVGDAIDIEVGGDLERLIRSVRKRLKVGQTLGLPKVYLEALPDGSSRDPLDILPLEGDETALRERELAEDEGDPGAAGTSAIANALARVALSTQKQNAELTQALLAVAMNNIELVSEATEFATELKVRHEFGYQEGWQKIIEQVAPQFFAAAPALLQIYAAYSTGDNGNQEAPTADGRFRQVCESIARQVAVLAAWASDPGVVHKLKTDPNLQLEVRGRLGTIITATHQTFETIIAGFAQPQEAT